MRRLINWFKGRWKQYGWWGKGLVVVIGLIGVFVCGFIGLTIYSQFQSNSSTYIRRWFNDPSSRDELITIQRERCEDVPFLLPSDGLIGLLWRDPAGPYNVLRRHSGIDIFGDGQPGEVPVYAAYAGYLTRLDNWVSAVIIQHSDPLESGRTIWTYYTHMASGDGDSYIVADFPPGTRGEWVEQGQLIGYQGEYNGSSVRPIGLHLHFSIVLSDDDGSFKNESNASNTLDPSPYLGMPLNVGQLPIRPILCDT
jgi:hypothetical protein